MNFIKRLKTKIVEEIEDLNSLISENEEHVNRAIERGYEFISILKKVYQLKGMRAVYRIFLQQNHYTTKEQFYSELLRLACQKSRQDNEIYCCLREGELQAIQTLSNLVTQAE